MLKQPLIKDVSGFLFACLICLCGFGASTGAAITATNLFPATGATNICPDTPLKISFSSVPAAPSTGTIRIYTAAGVLADTLNLGAPQTRIIGGFTFTNYAVILNGSTASIFPHPGALTTNQTYYVNIDAAVFSGYAGISDSNTWRFATKPALPAAGSTNLVVAADGSGDFATVQGAIDFVPFGNTTHTLVFIHKGVYQEIVYITNRNNLVFLGEDRTNTVIMYANNDTLNHFPSGQYTNYLRQSFGVDANDIVLENVSLTNSTPEGGTQAEVLRIDGYRCIANRATFHSYQDTLKVSGTVLFKDCFVEGDTDFIWGFGTTYFTNCVIKTLNPSECVTQARNGPNYYGYIFVNSTLTYSNGMATNNTYFGRGISGSHPTSSNACVAFINCKIDKHILAAGWKGDSEPTNSLRMWEYQSTDLTGTNLINVSGRTNFSSQLTAPQADILRYPTNVFGFVTNGVPTGTGWLPLLAPNFVSQPTNQTVLTNQTATFTATAMGVPDPVFQWLKNGTILTGATNASLVISNAQPGDAAVYSVIASNSAGAVTNAGVALTVNPPLLPQLGSPGWNGGQFQFTFSGGVGSNYAVQASSNLTQWQTVFSTNSPTLPFGWSDTNTSLYPARYYRVEAY